MPGWLYSAAGDGYFESHDYGQTWKRLVAGLGDYDYLVGLTVDSGDPNTVIVYASRGAYQAHSREDPESTVYRRTSSTKDTSDDANNSDDDRWEAVSNGLPEPPGTIISILAANAELYAFSIAYQFIPIVIPDYNIDIHFSLSYIDDSLPIVSNYSNNFIRVEVGLVLSF